MHFLPPYKPSPWLIGPHAQTVWGHFTRSRKMVSLTRETITAPDGDVLYLDHLPETNSNVHLLLFHGLEGSSFSPYIQGMLSLAQQKGWNASAFNFRWCARDTKRRGRILEGTAPRLYHSGDTEDADFIIRLLDKRHPTRALLSIGVSMGGNILLKWLGENPQQSAVRQAVTISVPYRLHDCATHLDEGLRKVYVWNFLASLRSKAKRMVQIHPTTAQCIDLEAMKRAKNFYDYDQAVTAPLHNFASAQDYYEKCSSLYFLPRITTETLCINALNDPFQPRSTVSEAKAEASDAVSFLTPEHGGHVGFKSSTGFRKHYWAEQAAITWLEHTGNQS